MEDLRIYNQSKAQIEPPVEGTVYPEEDIQRVIDGSFLCYVDTTTPYLVSKIRGAWTGGTTPRKNQYIAVYQASSVDRLFTEFIDHLHTIENNPNWKTIETPSMADGDQKYQYPWILAENHSQNLCDLGLEPGEQTSILKLIEEGSTLDLGLTSHAAAAATLAYLAKEVDGDIKIGISQSGRSGGADIADIVLKPGTAKNFEPLNNATETKIQKRFEELEDDIVSYYHSSFEKALSSLLNDTNVYFWDIHAELLRVSNSCLEDGPQSNHISPPQTDPGSRICEVISAIRHGEILDNKYDLAQLSASRARSELRDSTGRIQNEISQRERNAEELSQDFFDDILSRVDRKPRTKAYNEVRTMLTIVSGSSQIPTQTKTVRQFAQFYGWLTEDKSLLQSEITTEQNKLLTRNQISELGIQETLEKKAEKYLQAEQDDIFTEFENWIKGDRISRTRHYRQLEELKNAITSSLQQETNSADLNDDLSNNLNRLHNNQILSDHDVQEIKKDVRDTITKEQRQIKRNHVEYKEDQITSSIDKTISTSSNPRNKFEKLRAIEVCLKENKTVQTRQYKIKRIENFVKELENDVILDKKARVDIREHGIQHIKNQYPHVRKDIKGHVIAEIRDLLDRIPFNNVPVATAGQDLKTLRQRSSTGNKSTGSISGEDEYIIDIDEYIKIVITGEVLNLPYFDSHTDVTLDEVLDTIRENIKTKISDLRDQYKEEIISDLKDIIRGLKEDTNVNTFWFIVLLDDLLDRLARSHNKSFHSRQLDSSIDEYFSTEVEDLYTHIEKINNNGYEFLKYNDVRDIRDRLESIFTRYLSKARAEYSDVVTHQIEQEISDIYHLDNLQIQGIGSLVEIKNDLIEIESNIQKARQSRSPSVDFIDLNDETLNGYRALDADSQNSVLGEVSEWLDENKSTVASKLSSKIHRSISMKLQEIETDSDSNTTKLRRYSQFCHFSQGGDWELQVDDSYSSAISGSLSHLFESDYKEIKNRLKADRQAAMAELRETIGAEFEAALDDIETEVDGLNPALNSVSKYIRGEKAELDAPHFATVVDIIEDIEELQAENVISSSEMDNIYTDLLEMVSDRKDPENKIPDISNQTIFAVIFVGVVIIALATVVFLPAVQQTPETNQFTVSSVIIEQEGTGVSFSGQTTATDRVGITLVGPGEEFQRTAAVTEGMFETSFSDLSHGEYDLLIHPTGNASDGTRIKTSIVAPSNSSSPFTSLAVHSNEQGVTITGASQGNETTLDFWISKVKSPTGKDNSTSFQTNRTVSVVNGKFSFLLANSSSGTYNIQVQQHNGSLARNFTLTVPDQGEFRYTK
jgi:hypothetical protein